MISYATDGARYGLGLFLPFIVILFGMSYRCQEMCMRVGAVTHRGYGELVLQRFGPLWGWFGAGDLILTNLITLVSEFVAIRVGLAYFHLGAPVAAALGLGLVVVTVSGRRYWRWERVVLALAVFNGLFLVAAIMVRPKPGSLSHAFATLSPTPSAGLNTLLLLLTSAIGATVTPWMIFFQQSAVVDKGVTPKDLKQGRIDVVAGGLLAALAGCGAVVAASVLFTHHVTAPPGLGGADYAGALRAVSGPALPAILSLGLIEAGALACLTISTATAYSVGEAIGGAHSFNRKFGEAPLFYSIIVGVAVLAGLVVLIPGAPLLNITLNANLLATILMPAALTFLILLANDREIMGNRGNGWRFNVAAGLVMLLVVAAGAGSTIVTFIATVGTPHS